MSALCQEQTSTGANTGTVQIGRKSIAEPITGRIGTRPLCFKERAKFVGPSFLVIRILLKPKLQHCLDSRQICKTQVGRAGLNDVIPRPPARARSPCPSRRTYLLRR